MLGDTVYEQHFDRHTIVTAQLMLTFGEHRYDRGYRLAGLNLH
jgi:hypothetical protein